MSGSHRGSIEGDETAPLEDPIDDGLSEVFVVKDSSHAASGSLVLKIMERLASAKRPSRKAAESSSTSWAAVVKRASKPFCMARWAMAMARCVLPRSGLPRKTRQATAREGPPRGGLLTSKPPLYYLRSPRAARP